MKQANNRWVQILAYKGDIHNHLPMPFSAAETVSLKAQQT
jgi:hypothetical protein